MTITEVRIKLEHDREPLLAFASITFEAAFVIRDLKVIAGDHGAFVAMPSRKLTDRCACGGKCLLRARYCSECGAPHKVVDGCPEHRDTAHPITPDCRRLVEGAVLSAYAAEVERAQQPDYQHDYHGHHDGHAGH